MANEEFKFNEDVVAKEVVDYIASTYHAHYAGKEGLQTMDYLLSLGLAKDFCRGSAIKYLSRFGKKQGQEKLDLLKVIHYTLLLMSFSFPHTEDPHQLSLPF